MTRSFPGLLRRDSSAARRAQRQRFVAARRSSGYPRSFRILRRYGRLVRPASGDDRVGIVVGQPFGIREHPTFLGRQMEIRCCPPRGRNRSPGRYLPLHLISAHPSSAAGAKARALRHPYASFSQSAASPNFAPVSDGSMLRSRPVSTPPAPTSMKRVTPDCARARMESAQRTGLGTWL